MSAVSRLITSDLEAQIREQMARWTVPGLNLGVLRDDEREIRGYGVTSLETGYPVRPDTLFLIGSISKVYTAALVMTLVDAGQLDLDAPVVTYLPDLRLADDRARDTITLRHLLTHQSGLFGDSITSFQVKLKLVPARRFAIAILTNSERGGVAGERDAERALDHVLDLRARPHPRRSRSPRTSLRALRAAIARRTKR